MIYDVKDKTVAPENKTIMDSLPKVGALEKPCATQKGQGTSCDCWLSEMLSPAGLRKLSVPRKLSENFPAGPRRSSPERHRRPLQRGEPSVNQSFGIRPVDTPSLTISGVSWLASNGSAEMEAETERVPLDASDVQDRDCQSSSCLYHPSSHIRVMVVGHYHFSEGLTGLRGACIQPRPYPSKVVVTTHKAKATAGTSGSLSMLPGCTRTRQRREEGGSCRHTRINDCSSLRVPSARVHGYALNFAKRLEDGADIGLESIGGKPGSAMVVEAFISAATSGFSEDGGSEAQWEDWWEKERPQCTKAPGRPRGASDSPDSEQSPRLRFLEWARAGQNDRWRRWVNGVAMAIRETESAMLWTRQGWHAVALAAAVEAVLLSHRPTPPAHRAHRSPEVGDQERIAPIKSEPTMARDRISAWARVCSSSEHWHEGSGAGREEGFEDDGHFWAVSGPFLSTISSYKVTPLWGGKNDESLYRSRVERGSLSRPVASTFSRFEIRQHLAEMAFLIPLGGWNQTLNGSNLGRVLE
ncbi:hypothetical protein BC826DRAFT_971146 [Russula brevipes]|nr:hypothetical protein BC826DRAFT_971146 [Russula brevipes]